MAIVWRDYQVDVSHHVDPEMGDCVMVMVQIGPDDIEFFGKGKDLAKALEDLDREIHYCAEQHVADMRRYCAVKQFSEPKTEAMMAMAEFMQKNAAVWTQSKVRIGRAS